MSAHEMADPRIPPDQLPGFWPNWHAPTRMAEAIQFPLHPPEPWANRVLNAYRKTVCTDASPEALPSTKGLAAASLPTIADPVKQGGHHG